MFKRFFCLFMLLCSTLSVIGVEDIYITDTLKALPAEMELRSLYLQALCYKKQGRPDSALSLLNRYVERDTTNGAVYMDIANMYIAAGNYKESLANMRKAAKLEPENYWILRSEALLLVQNGNTDEGLKVYDRLVKQHPDKVEDVANLASLYMRAGNQKKALEMWNNYEKQVGITEQVSVQKFDLLYSMGKKKHAVAVLDSLIATDRTEPHFFLTKAHSLAYKGETKAAEKCLKNARKLFPESDFAIEQELSLIYLSTNQEKKALASIKKLLKMPEIDFEAKRSLLLSSVADSMLGPHFGDADFESLISQYPNNEQAFLIYSDYLQAKRDVRAYDYIRKALTINPENEFSWAALLGYYETTDSVVYEQTLNDALATLPESGQFHFYAGTLNMRKRSPEKALVEFHKAADLLKKDPNEKNRASVVYTVIGDVNMVQKDTLAAFAAYDSAVAYNSNNIEALNNYAYFLCEAGGDLELAERLSGKAIAAQPKNAAYLDTYAWIFYKMGKYSTARLYIEQAIMLGGDRDAECVDHYGDILFKDGDKKGALEAWNKALKLTENPSEKLKQKAETGILAE